MDVPRNLWHKSNIMTPPEIPSFDLYGESRAFPDVLHCETITARAALHDWEIGVHRHPGLHQFFLLTGGEAQMTAEGARRRLDLPALVSMPRLAAHGFRFAQGTQGFVVTIPVAELPEALAEGAVLATRLGQWLVIPAGAEIIATVELLAEEHRRSRFGRVPMLRALALRLAALVSRAAEDAAPRRSTRYADRIAALDQLVDENLRNRWSIADYAAALGLTPTHLSRITRAETGLSASRYVERQLFQEARRLLAYTRMSVGEVAWVLGFGDPAYFSRAFRRHAGEPPLAYRQRFAES